MPLLVGQILILTGAVSYFWYKLLTNTLCNTRRGLIDSDEIEKFYQELQDKLEKDNWQRVELMVESILRKRVDEIQANQNHIHIPSLQSISNPATVAPIPCLTGP